MPTWRYLRLSFENGDHDSDEGSITTKLLPSRDGSFHNQRILYTSLCSKARNDGLDCFNILIILIFYNVSLTMQLLNARIRPLGTFGRLRESH